MKHHYAETTGIVSIHERGTFPKQKSSCYPLGENKSFVALYEYISVYP